MTEKGKIKALKKLNSVLYYMEWLMDNSREASEILNDNGGGEMDFYDAKDNIKDVKKIIENE